MQSITRKLVSLLFVLLALVAFGCASAVDDSSPTSQEATASSADALKGEAASIADAVDCEQSAVSSDTDDYEEVSSILESMSIDDGSGETALSGCRRFCNCCRGGNRFCCKHCKFCSGPIGPYGVSTSLLEQ